MSDYDQLRLEILKRIKKRLSDKRFKHTLRVETEAVKLANYYRSDWQKASIAALLHDNAKNYDDDKKLRLVYKYAIKLNQSEENNIDLVHAKLGSVIAQKKFDITDVDILNAIKYHTTGRPGMSMTEKIIYIADFIEPGRKAFPGLEKARDLAYQDINLAMIKILMMTINHVIDKGKIIDPGTEMAYEYYYRLYAKEHPESNI